MKRRIQGLVDTATPTSDQMPDGVFLVRVDKARIDGMRRSLFTCSTFASSNPKTLRDV